MIGPIPKLKLGKAEKLELTHYEGGIPKWCITSKIIVDASKPNGVRREYCLWNFKNGVATKDNKYVDDPTLLYQ